MKNFLENKRNEASRHVLNIPLANRIFFLVSFYCDLIQAAGIVKNESQADSLLYFINQQSTQTKNKNCLQLVSFGIFSYLEFFGLGGGGGVLGK